MMTPKVEDCLAEKSEIIKIVFMIDFSAEKVALEKLAPCMKFMKVVVGLGFPKPWHKEHFTTL